MTVTAVADAGRSIVCLQSSVHYRSRVVDEKSNLKTICAQRSLPWVRQGDLVGCVEIQARTRAPRYRLECALAVANMIRRALAMGDI